MLMHSAPEKQSALETDERDSPGCVFVVRAQKEGLGKLPGNVVSVANLSLFNSTENPYRKYQSLDNLAGHSSKTSDTRPPPAPPRPLQSAPHTVAEGYTMPLMGSQVPYP